MVCVRFGIVLDLLFPILLVVFVDDSLWMCGLYSQFGDGLCWGLVVVGLVVVLFSVVVFLRLWVWFRSWLWFVLVGLVIMVWVWLL